MILLFQIVIFSAATAAAGEWPADAKARMDAAGARLSAATETAQRVAALRDIQRIAAAHPNADGARLTAKLLSEKATEEAGPGAMLDALGTLAASGDIADVQAYASIVGPLMETIGQMQDNKTLLPEAAIQLDKAVQKLDAAAAKAGLPSIAAAISQATGDDKLGSAVTNTLSRLAKIAELARNTPDLAKMNKEATTEYIYGWLEAASSLGGPAINNVTAVPFSQLLGWNNEMYGQSSQALNLVADAIETGKFDHKAYNKIRDRLNELSKGPWGSDTIKDMVKSLCKSIPIAGAWCDDAFKLVEELVGVSCGDITCDCENVGGGLMRGPLIVQCKIQEQDLISQCNATKKVTGKCQGDAKGPGASH
ncbi:MAG: hypothetical protein HKN11_05735 [Rhizobiales bacterium]|nr:hypothetical protein [Hyphomicrobiales bacterium]